MWHRCQLGLKGLLVLIACTVGGVVVPAEPPPAADGSLVGPPLAYRLEDVNVRVERRQGHGQPTRQFSLSGKGAATLQWGDQTPQKRHFEYRGKDLLGMLNGLYRSRFFELPAQLRPTVSLFLKDDGTVGTQALRMSDAGSTAVCFSVAGYEKCVRYDGKGPSDLDDWVQRLLADAERRAQAAAPEVLLK